MSITAGIDWDSSDNISESNMCRLCMKKNYIFYSIFSSNIAHEITVKDALHDLVGLQVSLGDCLPAIVCPLCVKKLTDFSDFKKICFESDAKLREISSRITPRVEPASQGNVLDAEGTRATLTDHNRKLVGAENEPFLKNSKPTFAVDGELIESCTMTRKSKMDSVGLPAPDRVPVQTTSYPLAERHLGIDPSNNCVASSSLVTVIESKTKGSHTGSEGNVMDKDLEKFDALHPDKMTSCSIPIDGQFCSKYIPESKISRDGAEVTVVGNRSGCYTPKIPHSLRFVRISENRRIGSEAVKEDKEEITCSLMENPGSTYRPNDNSYHCFDCRDAFDTKIELIKHLDIHFGADNGDVNSESSMGCNESSKTLVSTGESSSACDPFSSMTSNGLKKEGHGLMQKRNAPREEISGGVGEKKNLRRSNRSFAVNGKLSLPRKSSSRAGNRQKNASASAKEKRYPCGVCGRFFALNSSLTSHMRTHSGEKPYVCKLCGKSFSVSCNLVSHMRTHSGEKPYSCSVCSKSFTLSSGLKIHVRTHSGEKPYSCGVCGKSFTDNSNLKKHVRTHTGEKPYPCSVCTKSFAQSSTIYRHMQTHARGKRYSCRKCAKSFVRRSLLFTHMKSHT